MVGIVEQKASDGCRECGCVGDVESESISLVCKSLCPILQFSRLSLSLSSKSFLQIDVLPHVASLHCPDIHHQCDPILHHDAYLDVYMSVLKVTKRESFNLEFVLVISNSKPRIARTAQSPSLQPKYALSLRGKARRTKQRQFTRPR